MNKDQIRKFREDNFPADTIYKSRINWSLKCGFSERMIRAYEEGTRKIRKNYLCSIKLYKKAYNIKDE